MRLIAGLIDCVEAFGERTLHISTNDDKIRDQTLFLFKDSINHFHFRTVKCHIQINEKGNERKNHINFRSLLVIHKNTNRIYCYFRGRKFIKRKSLMKNVNKNHQFFIKMSWWIHICMNATITKNLLDLEIQHKSHRKYLRWIFTRKRRKFNKIFLYIFFQRNSLAFEKWENFIKFFDTNFSRGTNYLIPKFFLSVTFHFDCRFIVSPYITFSQFILQFQRLDRI